MAFLSDAFRCSPPHYTKSKKRAMACGVWQDVVRGMLPVAAFFASAAVTAACVFLCTALGVGSRLPELPPCGKVAPNDEVRPYREELAALLKKASMEDNTVIMTSINKAYAAPGSLLDLFLESFRAGDGTEPLLRHLLVVAVDPGALGACRGVHPHCYLLRADAGVDYSDAKFFMTKDYLDMMWARNLLQRTVLELGFNFLFSDIDIMWFRNPLRHVAVASDIAIACDFFNGDPDSFRNHPNGGLLYVKSKNRTVEFYRSWQAAGRARFAGKNEQYVFRVAAGELSRRHGVRVQFLDTARCGGFCEPSTDMGEVCTMHANCCLGLEDKAHDLRRVLEDWRNYTGTPPEVRRRGGFRWRPPARCSLKGLEHSFDV